MIPKVFHRVWIGGKPMPELFEKWGRSWLACHSGWRMKTWTEANLPPSLFPDLLARACSLSQRSNIHRYEIIHREGGVYVDTDFECLRSIEPLIAGCAAFAARQSDRPREVGVVPGIFGAVPGHRFLIDLLAALPSYDVTTDHTIGPPMFSSVADRHPEVRVLERRHFYPYRWDELHRRDESFTDAYAVHHWASQWTDSRKPVTGVT